MSAEEVRKAEETLRVALTITGQPELVYTSALSKANRDALRALATLTEHLERLERERDEWKQWSTRQGASRRAEAAEHREQRNLERAYEAEARVRELEEREKSQTGLPYLAVPEDHLIRANLCIAELKAALEAVLADDGNCTEDEPQDSSCPRCRARKLLNG